MTNTLPLRRAPAAKVSPKDRGPRAFGIIAALGAALTLTTCAAPLPARTEFVLGTVCTVNLYDRGTREAYDGIFARLREIESVLSANSDDSNLAEINARAGIAPVPARAETLAVLSLALSWAERTDGAFDPTIGPLVKAWNIGSDRASVPDHRTLEKALALVDRNSVSIDTKAGTVFLAQKGMKLDLGAIAKGYAADETARIIRGRGITRAMIDLGGNIYALGEKSRGKAWTIGIRDPETDRGSPILSLAAADLSVVTSGVYERFFVQDGKRYHHILDTKTGYPVINDLVSVTILSKSSIQADALSTATFALGAKKGKALIEGLPETGAIFIFADRHIETAGVVPKLNMLSDRFRITQ